MIGELATWYLFLAGAGAGALLVTAVLELQTPFSTRCFAAVAPSPGGARPIGSLARTWNLPVIPRDPFRQFFGPAYGAGFMAVAVGALCLLADLGRPDRLLRLLFAPTLSFIAVGVYLLLALGLCSLVLCLVWCFGAARAPRWLVAVARLGTVIGALAVMTYTGLLLASMPAIPFWNTAWVPLLFVASDFSTGIGLVVAAIVLFGSSDMFRTTIMRIKRWDAAVIAIEAICLGLLLGTAFFRGSTAQASATMMLSGSVAPQFWIMVVATGLVFPFLAERLGRLGSQRMMLSVSAALLISCFFLRWCVVQVGMAPNMAAAVMAALGSG